MALLPRPSFMDISPHKIPTNTRNSGSTASTPMDHHAKRLREEELDAWLEAPPSKRLETTPVHTPTHSPEHCGIERMAMTTPQAFGTPISSHVCDVHAAAAAAELRIRWANAQRQGPRAHMEDRSVCKLDAGDLAHGYFAVFDGHGGDEVADYCAEHLHANVLNSAHFPDLELALPDGFLRTDADLLARASAAIHKKESNAGSAAAAVVVTARHIWVAHAGDCRVVLVKRRPEAAGSFEELTNDHTAEAQKPGGHCCCIQPQEVQRVHHAGGKVADGYVRVADHNLPMTRAFGDLRLKVADGHDWQTTPAESQVVTALPQVRVLERCDNDLGLVLASDGLFGDVMTSEEVADQARQQLLTQRHTGDAEGKAARHLIDCALLEHQGGDNVAVVVVGLEPPLGRPPMPHPVLNQVVPLEHSSSQQSISTQVLSPGRRRLEEKLRLPFTEAYPIGERIASPEPPPPRQRVQHCDRS